jgi:hypothetical protein
VTDNTETRLASIAQASIEKYPGNLKMQAQAMEEVVRPSAELVYALARDCIYEKIIQVIKAQLERNRVSEAGKTLRRHQEDIGARPMRDLSKPTTSVVPSASSRMATAQPALTQKERQNIRDDYRTDKVEMSLLMKIRPNNRPMGEQTAQELNDWCDAQERQITQKRIEVRFVRLATSGIFASHAPGPVSQYLKKETELQRFWAQANEQEGSRHAA